jgi:antitoxin PrlF
MELCFMNRTSVIINAFALHLESMKRLQSTLTARYQTTIPTEVRRRLGLQGGDQITYRFTEEGRVELMRESSEDPILGAMLDALEHDVATHSERLVAVDEAMVQGLKKWDLDVDLDEDLDAGL